MAVFIPLIFMTGIVGRLFREFAITSERRGARLGGGLAHADADDVRASAAKRKIKSKQGEFYRRTERLFQGHARTRTNAACKWVLRHQLFVLLVASRRWSRPIWLYFIVPKGLLPQQDTGLILGVTDAAAIHFLQGHGGNASARSPTSFAQDPDVASVASFVGAGTVNPTMNTGRLYISLKPRDQRNASADEIIERLRDATRDVEGISLFHAGGAGRADRQPRQPHPVPIHPAGRR